MNKKNIEDSIIKHVKNIFRPKKEIDGISIKDVRNILRLKTEINDGTTATDIRNLFRLKAENKAIRKRIIREILGTNFSMKKKIITNQ